MLHNIEWLNYKMNGDTQSNVISVYFLELVSPFVCSMSSNQE